MSERHQVIFDGHDLSELITITSFYKGVNLGRTSENRSRKKRKGMEFLGYNSELVTYVMEFVKNPEIENVEEKLKKILNVDEPKVLTMNTAPNRLFYAFPQGNVKTEEQSPFGEGTIIWEIPDGVSYSAQNYLFTNINSEGSLLNYITINNPGTEPMDLELAANFKSDNGFLGLESDSGSVRALFGDIEEIDGYDYQVSEKLFDDHFNVSPGWTLNNGVIPPVTNSIIQQGTFSYKQEAIGEGFAYPTDYGTPTSSWSGPSLTKTIPPDSTGKYPENWKAEFRVDFNTDGAGHARASLVGHQSLSFIDQNNNIIVSIVIEDNAPAGQKSDLVVYVRNKRVYDSRNTTSYYVTARPKDNNHIKVEKIGNKINVQLAFIGRKMSFDFNEAGILLRKVTFYAARYKSLPPMRNNLLRAINITKHNVNKWQNIPNKFMAGDKLVYGKSDQNVYCRVNEMNALEMRDVGSTVISAPPGESILYLAYSSFADTPEVTLKGRAKYII